MSDSPPAFIIRVFAISRSSNLNDSHSFLSVTIISARNIKRIIVYRENQFCPTFYITIIFPVQYKFSYVICIKVTFLEQKYRSENVWLWMCPTYVIIYIFINIGAVNRLRLFIIKDSGCDNTIQGSLNLIFVASHRRIAQINAYVIRTYMYTIWRIFDIFF